MVIDVKIILHFVVRELGLNDKILACFYYYFKAYLITLIRYRIRSCSCTYSAVYRDSCEPYWSRDGGNGGSADWNGACASNRCPFESCYRNDLNRAMARDDALCLFFDLLRKREAKCHCIRPFSRGNVGAAAAWRHKSGWGWVARSWWAMRLEVTNAANKGVLKG
jgi:hypothetical protein